MAEALQSFRSLWGAWDAATRFRAVAALLLTALVLSGIGVWASQTPYSTVMKGRQWEDVLDAAAALDGAEIPYRIRDGALEVPSQQLGAAQGALRLSEALPGLSDVGDLQLGLTPTAQAWAFLRAREGDLAGAIQSIDGITAARVHIVPQSESLFVGDEEPARASVFLRLRPGHKPPNEQVRAVSNLVASAVDGLSSDRVTVVDDRGHLLAEGSASNVPDAASAPAHLLEYRTALERRYEQAVTQSLLPVVGYDGGFSVTASVDVDMTSTDTVKKSVDTEKQAVLSEQLQENASTRNTSGGVPGVDSNLPGGLSASSGPGQQQESSVTRTNYTYPTVDEVAHQPAGSVQRVSVAVQVDANKLDALATAAGIDADEMKTRIDSAVRAAIGFDVSRNDQVVVQFLPFTPMEELPAAASANLLTTTAPALLDTALPYVLGLVALWLTFSTIVRPLVSAATTGPTSPAAIAAGEAEAAADDNVAQLRPEEQVARRLKTMIDDFDPVNASELSTLVNQQPRAAAKVLKQWQQTA